MTRSRASARAAGTRAESAVAKWLARVLNDDRIERRAKTGAKDRGDIAGVRVHGQRVVVEVKDVVATSLASWTTEAEVERGNDDALVGIVVHKRRGSSDPGEWYVTMKGTDLVALLTGSREGLADDTLAA